MLGDTAPELHGDDSYRAATETHVPDDNRTATGTIKSYRKTPFSSRAGGINTESRLREADPELRADGPRDEHRVPLHELLTRLVTDTSTGLGTPQVRANQELFGPNSIAAAVEVPEWVRFAKCIFGGSSLFLWAGTLLCFVNYSIAAGETDTPPMDNVYLGVALLFVILLTGAFSFIQEHRGAAIAKTYEKLCPHTAHVLRECVEEEVPAEELVMGDIIFMRAGDIVPADCRILDSNGFTVDNSVLTGESEPFELDVHTTHESQLSSRNMAFYSTFVVRGSARAVVTRTGINTVMGQMADLTASNPKDETLITRELSQFIHLVTGIGVAMGLVFFVISFLVGYFWIDSILFMIGVVVACVPEGLLAIVTIGLSISARRLSSRNCIVKNLEAVETLGSTSVLLCDKTGTLTKNQPTVAHIWLDNNIGEVDTGAEGTPAVSFDLRTPSWKNLARIAVLCNSAEFVNDGESGKKSKKVTSKRGVLTREVSGSPIDAALLRIVEALEGNTGTFRNLHPKVCEIPFSPIIKFHLTIHEAHDLQTNGYLVTMLGDPETVLTRCSTALVNGQERTIDEDFKQAFRYACAELGGLGERLVALCDTRLPVRKFPPGFTFNTNKINFPLSGFRMVGIMALMDPPRASVPDAIAKCQAAGIKVIMATGDHPSTAKAIAKSVGILSLDQDPLERTALMKPAQSCLVTGDELNELKPEELDHILMHHQEVVLAGFSAEQKLAIVESCQRLGAVVAVTGDGVNDAAALHKADCGIAMGIAGSDVAKQAADVILLDDNFSSIVVGIEEGRLMFDNLKKCLFYILASNVAEIAPFILFLVAQIPLPIGALAVLCIDLGTDLLPAVSLSYEEEEVRYATMRRGPRNPLSEGLLDERLLFLSCGQFGLIQAAAGFFTYFVIMAENGFWPSRLLALRKFWESRAINDLRDSYDQEWTYEDRKSLEYSCHAGFFFTIVLMQWITLISSRSSRLSVFQRGMNNWVLNFALLFETLIAFVLIYIPGLNNGLQMENLSPVWWFPPIPFIILLFVYDELRKAIIRKHPGGWTETETCFATSA